MKEFASTYIDLHSQDHSGYAKVMKIKWVMFQFTH